MAQKKRGPGQTAISLSLEADLLEKIDARADSLRLSRSTYLALLAGKDIAEKGDLVIREKIQLGNYGSPKPERMELNDANSNSAPASPAATSTPGKPSKKHPHPFGQKPSQKSQSLKPGKPGSPKEKSKGSHNPGEAQTENP